MPGEPVNNLPLQPTPLIGREQEFAALTSLLSRADVRLVTLTGFGGIGKTRLSLQVAAHLLPGFADGVVLVTLAGTDSASLVVPTIAQTLELREERGKAPLESLKEYLRDKQLLLILDNFDRVVAAAMVIVDLLASCPQIKILVTSRAVLRVRGENEFPVPPLALPDLHRSSGEAPLPLSVESLSQSPAVALFVRRAMAAKPDFALTPENAAAVAEICARLDGLPLAIELAAARIRVLSPQAMLARLQSRLKLLTGGARDLPTRQQTLRGAIDYSFDLLDAGEKLLFQRLAIFMGGFTIEAADAVCNAGGDLQLDTLDGVDSLAGKSLIRQAAGDEPRFLMLETLREYGLEKLAESGEEAAVRRQHAAYFLSLAEAADAQILSARRAAWLQRLDVELDNLRAALSWSLGSSGDALLGTRLAGALHWFWYFRGYLSEGRRWLEEALAAAPPQAAPQRAKLLYAIGGLSWLQGDFAVALARTAESVPLWRALDDWRGLAYSLALLGLGKLVYRQPLEARTLSEESVALFRQVGDQTGLALSLYTLGFVVHALGDDTAARSWLEESVALFRAAGDAWGIALPLTTLGDMAAQRGEYSAARSIFEESIANFRAAGDKRGLAQALTFLGELAYHNGDSGRAASLLGEGLALRRELGNRANIAEVSRLLAAVARAQGDYQKAASLCRESLQLRRDLQDGPGIAASLAEAALILCARSGALLGNARPADLIKAARLLSAAEKLSGGAHPLLHPSDQADYQQAVAAVRGGMRQEVFPAAWAEGEAMTSEQAITEALDSLSLVISQEQAAERLRIAIDDDKTAREVAEITENDYFQSLQATARKLRAQKA